MSASRTRSRARLAVLATAALTLTGLQLSSPAQANPAGTGLVISEAYGGGGNSGATLKNDFVELYNPTNSAISVNGMSIQYRSGAGSGAPSGSSVITPLSGSVPAKGYFLVQESAGVGGTQSLPTPDASGSIAMSGTTFTVWLATTTSGVNLPAGSAVNNPQIVDLVGVASNTFETSAAAGVSNTTSASRTAAGLDRDTNNADLTLGAPDPKNSRTGGTTTLALTNPGPQTATVGTAVSGPTLSVAGGTSPYTYSATGLPNGLSLNASTGVVSGTPTTAGTSSVTARVTDAASTPAADQVSFSWTVTSDEPTITRISDIQGTGTATPLSGQSVTTQGVVTASYPTGGLNGFYLQTPGEDTTPDASDAIFVYGGPSGFTTYPAVGDSVRVTGTAGEFSTQTQLSAAQSGVRVLPSPLGSVVVKTQVPGTDCALPGGSCLSVAALDTAREVVESEAFQPTADWTATDVYDGGPAYNNGSNSSVNRGEIGIAADSSVPLVAPTELFDTPSESGAIANRTKYNQAHRIILDDASSTSYTETTGAPFPWLTATHSVRVGAHLSFPAPVVFTYSFNAWRILPTSQVVGAPSSTQPQFSQTRAGNLAPRNVGGDLKLATFNVLNFFPTTGEEYVASGLGSCSYYEDRQGARITVNSCGGGSGPRGAANEANLTRQRDKIVSAINGSGADIVSLEELENSVKFGKDRDFAISELVDALNLDAGAGTWDFVPSPDAADLPATADQDVIRNGFIYKPGNAALVGGPVVLADQSSGTGVFANAREPLAQAFKKLGSARSSAFVVIVNHFKSKGSGFDDGTGQGNANPDRVAQAESLATFADEFKTDRDLSKVFLVGDFNAYSMEDPIQVLTDAGYENLESSSEAAEESYNFDGQVGSLDHVLANPAAAAGVSGVDIWRINADESVYYEYSRFNYNVTNLYSPGPFRSSDHNPEIVGLNVAPLVGTTLTATDATVVEGSSTTTNVRVDAASGDAIPTGTIIVRNAGTVLGTGTLNANGRALVSLATESLAPGTYTLTAAYGGDDEFSGSSGQLTLTVTSALKPIQILATNDFHGRIQNDSASASAGAGILAGAVKQLRAQNPNTVFAAAGDLIGASTFESFIAKDKPTIDALNSAGLEVSAVGNHEFDQGYDDLVNRVMASYDADTNPNGGAQWKYLGANVKFKDDGSDALDGTWIKTMDGVQVGFIGAVTEHLPELVSPGGIADIEVTDIVNASNQAADDLEAEGADVVILLVHEGAPSTDCAAMDDDPTSDFGSIVTGVDDNVDAIVSGHTHLAYNCSLPVAGWSGRAVTERPVVSAGQYGANLNKLVFDVDTRTGEVASKTQSVLALKTGQSANYPVDQPTQDIVNQAVSNAAVLGAQELGQIAAPFKRGAFASGSENRGAESTLGNLVAEVQRTATSTPTAGNAQIAFMNPGGLRDNLLGNTGPGSSRTVTFKQAANVQPFANTLVNMQLTGAQIKNALEQQWQPAGASRPFLRLGISKGFDYTYNPSADFGSRITQMWLDGAPIDPAASYSVTVNSFLATGGDNFLVFKNGRNTRDTGQSDLQAMVDYLDELANVDEGDDPLPVDYSQRSVGVKFPASAPSAYRPGQHVVLDVSSFSMTNPDDVKDTEVEVRYGTTSLGVFPLDNTAQSGSSGGFDETGKATVDVVVPNVAPGVIELELVGNTTGTSVTVPVVVDRAASTVTAPDVSATYGDAAVISATVTGGGPLPTGTIDLFDGTTFLRTVTLNARGKATIPLPRRSLEPGITELTLVYSGDARYDGDRGSVEVTIAKAPTTVDAVDTNIRYGRQGVAKVTVTKSPDAGPISGTVTISEGSTVLATATLTKTTQQIILPPQSLPVGTHILTVTYSGSARLRASTGEFQVRVIKAGSVTNGSVTPTNPRAGQDRVQLNIQVTSPDGVEVMGQVEVTIGTGAPRVVDLVDGEATLDLGRFNAGRKTFLVKYLGSDTVAVSQRTVSFTVSP